MARLYGLNGQGTPREQRFEDLALEVGGRGCAVTSAWRVHLSHYSWAAISSARMADSRWSQVRADAVDLFVAVAVGMGANVALELPQALEAGAEELAFG
jgi:hypothetical protein